MTTTPEDDEAYARELQAQFEREAANALNNANNNSSNGDNRRRGRRGRGRRSRDNNNHGDRSAPSSVDAPGHSTATASAPNTTARASAPPTETDEEMARRLQQEMKDKDHAKRSHRKERAARSRARSPAAQRPSAPPAEQVLEESRGSSEPPKKTQEEKDAELAKRIHRKEKAKARAAAAAAKEGDDGPDGEKTGLVATNPSPPDASAAAAAGATQEEKDAELARLLQRKEKERAKGNGRSGRRSPTAPTTANHHDKAKQQEEEDERLARKINHAEQARARRHHHKEESKEEEEEEEKKEETPVTDNDEELARRLEQELRDEELARRLNEKESRRRRRTSLVARRNKAQQKRNQSQSPLRPTVATDSPPDVTTGTDATLESSNGSGADAVRTGRSKSPVRHKKPARERLYPDYPEQYPEQAPDFDEYEDMEMALRVEQEEKDAALARQLSHHEMRRLSVYRVADNAVQRRRPWTCKRIMTLSLPLLLILGAVVGLAFVFGGRGGLPRLPGTPPVFRDDDPFEGINPEDANRWRNDPGKGLYLQVLNALQSQWEESFNVAVSEWDFGNPDALSLTATRVAIDPDCQPQDGVMKVCNGDYGENRWRGINQVMISNGFIINSIAKLNEFYLRDADEAQRQYTMCHEIGHGFGLPHTDEDFFNADLGNCMDYTSNPAVNKSPDQSNYLFLFDLYGLVETRGDPQRGQGRRASKEMDPELLETRGDPQRGQGRRVSTEMDPELLETRGDPQRGQGPHLPTEMDPELVETRGDPQRGQGLRPPTEMDPELLETQGDPQRGQGLPTGMDPELLKRYDTAVREVANANVLDLKKMTFPTKLMHHDEHSEMVAVSLGDGIILEFHKLLAEPTLTPTGSPATTQP